MLIFKKWSKNLQFFVSWGTVNQVLGAKIEIDSVSYVTLLEFVVDSLPSFWNFYLLARGFIQVYWLCVIKTL